MTIHDYIVIGSGCSGAIAAQTLVESGKQVLMLDAGITADSKIKDIPDQDFLSLRCHDPSQYRYLIGEKASGVSWGNVGKGEQITPPRRHIMQSVEEVIPVASNTFSPLESLGYGGLGIGWGLQCWEYSKADLEAAGLNVDAMTRAYKTVANRIGVSASDDDASKYTLGTLDSYQASPHMDRNHTAIYRNYIAKRKRMQERGFYMGRTPLALITKDKEGRKGYQYHDMDFYSDNDLSAWRPWITVDNLKKRSNFTYVGNQLAVQFTEKKDYTEVTCHDLTTNTRQVFRCRKLVLATSALGSARLVLRSLGQPDTKLPLLCNPYSYVPCVQPRFVGKAAEPNKLGFTQLSLFYDKDHSNSGTSVASLYSYQSLMLFRIIRHVPLDFADARILMRYLMSGIVIMGIHHPDFATSRKYVNLVPSRHTPTGDKLSANFVLEETQAAECRQREKQFVRAMASLGVYSLKRMDPGNGASIHYAGTLPFSDSDEPFTLANSGRLHGTKSVYVADSAGFKYLPAPGLTFSLMANAHLVAESALNGR
jgi:hypothetical protein